MLYGTVLRAPVEGSSPEQIDDSTVAAIPGVIRIVRLALRRRRAGRDAVGRDRGAPGADRRRHLVAHRQAWGFDSDQGLEAFAAAARDLERAGQPTGKHGRRARRDAQGGDRLEAEYRSDYAYHAQMEPLNAVAIGLAARRCGRDLVRHAEPDAWPQEAAAKVLGIARDKVTLQRPADGRRLRPTRPSRRGIHRRRGAAGEGGRGKPVKVHLDARGRRPQRPLAPALRALFARRARRHRQARRLAPSPRRRPRDAVRRSGALRTRRPRRTSS